MEEKNKQADGVKTAGVNLREEIERIVRGEDSDASLILGPHWIERDGKRVLVIRAFRPGATEASLLWSGNPEPQAMTQIHRDGAFEAIATPLPVSTLKRNAVTDSSGAIAREDEAASASGVARLRDGKAAASSGVALREGEALAPHSYRLRFRFADGNTWEDYDPYAFPPLLTDYDLYLSGEGTHYLKYEKQGAHVREIDGVRGVHFGVWAPNAQRVSVVGDF
ncbi:MAG TPA: hypothetical protein VHN10_04975, partial [Candidatus Acidoferrales bacterium]|nr:hypothetical protein [Candidatus Acidoferrales bacterium]